MVKRCAWGECNGDERYKERLDGATLIPFPKPKTNPQKCMRWIKACGRPHSQLNMARINKHKCVCSIHFVGGCGPAADFPDPIQADGSQTKKCRRERKRHHADESTETSSFIKKDLIMTEEQITPEAVFDEMDDLNQTTTVEIQTDESWVSPMDFLTLTAELQLMKETVELQRKRIHYLEDQVKSSDKFGVKLVIQRGKKIKNLFQYYTGICYRNFESLFSFLCTPNLDIQYETGRKDIKSISNEDALFLTLCRLRHNLGLKDIAVRFQLNVQSCSVIFNCWIKYMYFKFGQISIWPHRDTIIEKMPCDYKREFPTTLIIIDATELRTQVPRSNSLNTQMYSDYKSSVTYKGLIGCDPNGSLMFISELHTGSISDKKLTMDSSFYNVLKQMKEKGFVKSGDAVMADKGFTIQQELQELGLYLNIPPFARAEMQMSTADTRMTEKIARHRIHVERLISRVKLYKIISHKIPATLFHSLNTIWTVCAFLTLFQEGYLASN